MDLLKDNPNRLFYKFLIPAISSAIAIATYSFVDSIAIGQGVGANGAAACAVVLPIFSIAHFLALLCGVGGSVLMSQARGSGNREKGDAYFTVAFMYLAFITIITWGLGVAYQEQFYRLCGADDILMPYAMDYGSWIFLFFPSFVLVYFLECFVRADGAPKLILRATLIGGVVNIIGDIILVFPLHMGMKGAAIATVLGSLIQTIMLIGYLFSKQSTLKMVKPKNWLLSIQKISAVGFGAGFSQLAIIAVTFIINNQIMRYSGAPALAVYGMLSTVSALFMGIFSGVGQAVQPIASVNYGSGQTERYLHIGKIGLKTAMLFGLLCTAICIAIPSQITAVFMKMTSEVEAIAPYIVRVYAISFFPLAISMFATLYLQAIARERISTTISLLRGIILNSILLYVLPLIMQGNGIWWAVTIAESTAAMFTLVYISYLYRKI